MPSLLLLQQLLLAIVFFTLQSLYIAIPTRGLDVMGMPIGDAAVVAPPSSSNKERAVHQEKN